MSDEPQTRRRGDTPSKLERYGMIGLLVVQFGYHEAQINQLRTNDRVTSAAVASVVAATDERKGALESTIERLEAGAADQARTVQDLRLVVVELRAAMTERRRR